MRAHRDGRGRRRSPARSLAVLLLAALAALGWIVLPSLHGWGRDSCSAATADRHAHSHGCPVEHGSREDSPRHDESTCAICRLASLASPGGLALPSVLPRDPIVAATPTGAEELAPRPPPRWTDAPPRGPPTA